MQFDRLVPFNDLPDLPPKLALETNSVLKRCIAARSALAELKGVGETIPNQALLIRSIGLQEARSSSEIENIVTTTDDLYRALADSIDKTTPATKEVLRYQEALQIGHRALLARPLLTTSLFCELASHIKECDMNIRTMPGTRIEAGSGNIIYTPPEGESIIRAKLKNLEDYLHTQTDIDPLVKLAVMHYQFEAIHPFTDGNGRTGRILNVLYLVQQNLVKLPILHLSKYFIDNKNAYYAGLRKVTEQASWEEWLLYILTAVEQTANETRSKIIQIRSLTESTQQEVKEKLPNVYSKDLVEILFEYPYCKRQFLVEKEICSLNTASAYLHSLEKIGILTSVRSGRDLYFVNRRLLNVLKS